MWFVNPPKIQKKKAGRQSNSTVAIATVLPNQMVERLLLGGVCQKHTVITCNPRPFVSQAITVYSQPAPSTPPFSPPESDRVWIVRETQRDAFARDKFRPLSSTHLLPVIDRGDGGWAVGASFHLTERLAAIESSPGWSSEKHPSVSQSCTAVSLLRNDGRRSSISEASAHGERFKLRAFR